MLKRPRTKIIVWIVAASSVFATGVAAARVHGPGSVQTERAATLYGEIDHVHLLQGDEQTRQIERAVTMYGMYDIEETASISPQGFLEPLVINENGDLAGIMSDSQGGPALPFLKTKGGPVLGVVVSGGSFGSRIFDLNEKGVAVGQFSKEPGGKMTGYIASQQSGATLLDYRARSINESGWIIGNRTVDGKTTALLVKGNETISLPPIERLPQSFAVSMNDEGIIVGSCRGAYANPENASKVPALPTMWDQKGVASQLPMPPFTKDVSAVAINNKGTVALFVRLEENRPKHFLLDLKGSELREIPTLNNQLNFVSHLNDRDEMVGYTQSSDTDEMHAWLYKDGQTIDLVNVIPKDSEIIPEAAMWINNKGQIVGLANKKGRYVGFIMTPRRTGRD